MDEKGASVRCSVFSGGNPVGTAFGLVSVHVEKGVNRIGRATLVYLAEDISSTSIPESDDETFAVGSVVRVEAGYDEDESPLFEGIVVAHGVEIGRGNDCRLRIECRDHAFPMTLGRRNRVFRDSTDGMAIEALLAGYPSLRASVGKTATLHRELVQYYCSDWDFMLSLVDRNGLEVITEGDRISVEKCGVDNSPLLKLTYGPDIVEFQADVSAFDQMTGVRASAWDPVSQRMIHGTGNAPELNAQGAGDSADLAIAVGGSCLTLQTVSTVDSDALAEWAAAVWLKAGMARIQGAVSFSGTSCAVAGAIVQLDGFGKRFDGNAYAGAVEHRIEEGVWETTVHMGVPPDDCTDRRNVTAPAASGLLPGIGGLHIGKVTGLTGDPEGNGRIQVEIPTLNGDDNTVWARLASCWAGDGYGVFFVPDEGDEVAVGFFNDDPCYPVVLGSLYNNSRPAPYGLTDDNYTRALVTGQKMKLVFDEEKKEIVLETPGGNSFRMSDKGEGIALTDKNGNTLSMDGDGITLESAKDFVLRAAAEVKIEAGSSAGFRATSDLKIRAANIEATADIEAKFKGNATVELSASGQTVVKGAMVMIN